MSKFISLLLLCLLAIFDIHAKTVEFPQLPSEPVIDGKGDDAAWKGQPWHGGFSKKGVKPAAETFFKTGVYNGRLYFLVKAEEPYISSLKKTFTKRDDLIYFDDSIEIMLDAENQKQNLSQIIVNTLGSIYDSYYSQGGMVDNPSWNFNDVRTAVFIDKDCYLLEISLPMAELGFIKGDGKIRFNIVRNRRGKKRETSTFSLAMGSFQVPETFAKGIIHDPELISYAYRLSAPYQLVVKDGKTISGTIQLTNLTGKLRFLEFFANGKKAGRRVIESGHSNEISFTIPYSKPSNLLIEVKEKGKTRLCQSRLLDLEYQPISIILSQPVYRDNIYSDEKIDAIKGTVQISDSRFSGKPISLQFLNHAGKVLHSSVASPNGNFSIPAAGLKDGQYTLIAKSGDLKMKKIIRKLPHVSGEVRFNQHGVMLVDGKPFTPYGWFRMNPKDGAREGYNLNFYYYGPWVSDDVLKAYFDNAQKLGLKVITYCYPKGNMMQNNVYKRALSDIEAKLIYERVAKFSKHPAVLGWYLADEPEFEPWLRERLEKVAEVCRQADPYHPTIIVNNSVSGVVKYHGIGDVSMPDFYPGFLENGNTASPIGRYGELLASSYKLDKRAQWGIPQGFTWGAYGAKGHRVPNYDELRNMHYQTLVNGQTGIVWYSYELNYTEPSVHIHVKKLLDEMKLFRMLWQNPQLRKEVSMTASLAAASYKNVNGHDYLVAVNLTPGDLNIDLPSPTGKELFVAGEKGVRILPKNGRIKDKLSRYRTRVYTTNKALASAFTAQPEHKAVEKAMKKLHKPGNLAYYRACPGIKFTSSLLSDPRIPLYNLCDGADSSMHVFNHYKDKRCEVTIIFPKKVKIARVDVYGRKMNSFKVHSPSGNFGEFRGKNKNFARVQIDNPIETDRITISKFDGVGISEIEIYSTKK